MGARAGVRNGVGVRARARARVRDGLTRREGEGGGDIGEIWGRYRGDVGSPDARGKAAET